MSSNNQSPVNHNQNQLAHEEASREAWQMYRKYHKDHSGRVKEVSEQENKAPAGNAFPMFQATEKTGVIFATARAKEHGFNDPEDPTWANMGQGAPETGPILGAPSRKYEMHIPDHEIEYAPTSGIPELREKVAEYYNHLYRQDKQSKYTAANVCIVPGGRAGITRIMAIMGNTTVGYFNPDYTAYEQALGLFQRITPSVFLHRDVNDALMPPDEFEFETVGRGLGAVMLSNPANPTGQSLEGDDLREYVRVARENQVALIMDEFYSHYYYDGEGVDPADGGADDDTNWPKTVSSAAHVNDVNEDPVLIINGLTKNWRCPGFRVCWIVAPAPVVSMLNNAGSYLDGGANGPMQRMALPLMDLDFIRRDTWALQRHFRTKRDYLLKNLARLGIKVKWEPTATFYIWGDLSGLPPPLNDSIVFLEECAKHKIICVPGVFFDINPRGVRQVKKSNCLANVRFSYGPSMRNLEVGIQNMEKMIRKWMLHTISLSTYVFVRKELTGHSDEEEEEKKEEDGLESERGVMMESKVLLPIIKEGAADSLNAAIEDAISVVPSKREDDDSDKAGEAEDTKQGMRRKLKEMVRHHKTKGEKLSVEEKKRRRRVITFKDPSHEFNYSCI
uniref:Aminotransferase class I/classII large domain-containing protein n=1 Tax=Pseudictyota dubia TaxID=2749911 RepID=A0A7R9YY82_9STRA|mmetsp:Transcript_14362/g.27280  ORF Transcript_14362/g.27280 Transcript_14362/m.27280 type:complete len:618 (+) Transcript_14362:188-2041(+)